MRGSSGEALTFKPDVPKRALSARVTIENSISGRKTCKGPECEGGTSGGEVVVACVKTEIMELYSLSGGFANAQSFT